MAPAAHANIVSALNTPITPPSTLDSVSWDVDGSGESKIMLQNYVSSALLFVSGRLASESGFVHKPSVGEVASFLCNLPVGFTVGKSLKNGYVISLGGYLTCKGANEAEKFTLNTPGYFGFKFTGSNSDTYYGYGELLITGTPVGQGFTIEDAYYNNTPGASIDVGAVPEPSSGGMALLALGATGLAAWRMRRKKAA